MDFIKSARWIRPKRDFGDVCPVFERSFDCVGDLLKATLYITAMGVYEATLNGERVGDFILAPGWTSYDERHQYQKYDITNSIKNTNSLCVTVGKGWYRGPFLGWREKDIYGGSSGIIAAIEIEYKNGESDLIFTDSNWKVAESPIRFSEIYDGEIYDSNLTEFEWEDVEFFCGQKNSLIEQEGCIVTEQEVIDAVAMFKTPNGETVVDFGQNLTGYVAFEIEAKKGEKLAYSHGEILDSEGNFYNKNLRSAKQKIEYICCDGKQSYKPHHTFMGFRYTRIDEAPKALKAENFKAIVVHSNMKRTGYFKCSNPKVNKLYSNVIWGQKGNFVDVPTDCPQRDERLGWTGDAQVFVKTASYNFDVRLFFKKWLKDLAAGQLWDGSVPAVIPAIIDTLLVSTGAAWGDAAVICPWQIYLTYNEREVLEDQLESMINWVEYMHSRGEEEFLWLGDNQYGDWLALDNGDGTYIGASDPDLIASAYFAYSTSILVKTLKVLNKDSSHYEKLLNNVISAFKKRFTEYKTQTECALVLFFDLVDEDKKKSVAKKLAELIKSNGNKLTTGFVGTPYILDALTISGYTDLAYTLLLQEEYPSWLFSVNMGATTIWEHWDGMREDGTMWSDDMNSFNHYAYGSVASWMYETMAGIKIDENKVGFENVILCPKTDDRLDWVEASIDTAYGTVSSKWERMGGKTEYTFKVPNSAEFHINGEVIPLGKGEHKFTF